MEVPMARVPPRPACARAPFPRAQLSAPAGPARAGPARAGPARAGPALARPAPAAPAPAGPAAGRAVRSAEPRHRRHEPDEVLPNAVLVTGYPPYTKAQDLAHAFCKFGSVRLNHEWVTDAAACLEFTQPEHAQAAIRASRAVYVYGAFLTVTACTVRTRPQRQPRRREPRVGRGQNFKGTTVEPAEIPLQGPFHQQLEALLCAVRLTQPEIERLTQLYRDLEYVLGELWPGCRAIPFGSVTTGLGTRSSDADCFVQLPPAAGRAGAGPVGRARRALAAHPRVFGELLAIPRANTPIVKFLHLPTRVYCDLSFKTPLGSQNSKLIAFLLFSDPRLIPVAVVVKYWARVHDLTGTGKLTNYALTMMIIFYFQQPPVSILPAVEWLQRERGYDFYVDYWNAGFLNDARRMPRPTNTSSVAELLGGFFEYYASFDFERLVVCPFLGRTVTKDDFRDLRLLPDEFSLYKKNVYSGVSLPIRFMTAACVQDPFEQCHNVASSVSSRLAADLRAYFKFAADAYSREKSRACSGLLPAILLQKPQLPRASRSGSEFRARLPPALVADIAAPDWKATVRELTFQIFQNILRVELEEVHETVKPTSGETSDSAKNSKPEDVTPGSSKTGDATQGMVPAPEESAKPGEKSEETSKTRKEICKSKKTGKAQEKERVGPEKKGRASPENKEKSKIEIIKNGKVLPQGGITGREKERYSGEVTRAIWKRKVFSKLYSVMGLKFVDRETMITDEILRIDKNVIDVKFQVLVTFVNAPRRAAVSVRHTGGDLNAFKEFGKFFNNTFQHWFVILYRPHCKKPIPSAVAGNGAPAVTDEEAAAKELTEAMKGEKDFDKSDTDSDDSDISYEDERVDPNATNSEDVSECKNDTKLQSDADKNSKNRSNSAVQKQSKIDKECETKENCDNNVRTDKKHDENELNASDKSPRKRKNKTQRSDQNLVDHLKDKVEVLNLRDKSPRKHKNNTRKCDKNTDQQQTVEQKEGKESRNTSPRINKNRTQHGDHNDTCQEIAKTKSPRHRHKKGKDKVQSGAPEGEAGRAREHGQVPQS